MKSWTCFILGNAIVVVVVIIEILTLSVCFTDLDQSEGFDDDRLDAAKLDEEEAYELDQAEHTVFNMVTFALVAGLFVEVVSAIVLSTTYRSPLDAKSAHKIPADDRRYCLAGFIARFFAPLIWGLICVCMGVASYMYSSYESCDGNAIGDELRFAFVVIFGLLMACCGGILVVVSMLLACFACGVEPTCMGCCCSFGRRFMHKRVLSTAPFFDLWWQLSGIMWSYRTGSFGLYSTVGLLVANIVGEIMSELGSSAPLVV